MTAATKMWTLLALLLLALPALGEHERTFRCLTSKDKPSEVLVPQLLTNLSSCSLDNRAWQTLSCAEKQVPRGVMSLTSSLLSTVRRWEAHYRVDINTAFDEQKVWDDPSQTRLGLTAWDVLLDSWRKEGELCFFDGDPKFSDHLLPRNAGLLSLFLLRDNLRSPILKVGSPWNYGQSTACSALKGTPRALYQLRTIQAVIQQAGGQGLPTWRVELEARHYREVYSTDPFLQGLFSGWRNTGYPCPNKMQCQTTRPEKGKVYVPHHGRDYLYGIADIIAESQKVCLLFGEGPLEKDVYYIAVGRVESESDFSL